MQSQDGVCKASRWSASSHQASSWAQGSGSAQLTSSCCLQKSEKSTLLAQLGLRTRKHQGRAGRSRNRSQMLATMHQIGTDGKAAAAPTAAVIACAPKSHQLKPQYLNPR